MFVRSIGSGSEGGPVRSGLLIWIGLWTDPDPSDLIFFGGSVRTTHGIVRLPTMAKKTKKLTCHFWANFANRPGILAFRVTIRTNPGTIGKIRPKVAIFVSKKQQLNLVLS